MCSCHRHFPTFQKFVVYKNLQSLSISLARSSNCKTSYNVPVLVNTLGVFRVWRWGETESARQRRSMPGTPGSCTLAWVMFRSYRTKSQVTGNPYVQSSFTDNVWLKYRYIFVLKQLFHILPLEVRLAMCAKYHRVSCSKCHNDSSQWSPGSCKHAAADSRQEKFSNMWIGMWG
jgi:hypothetical protein